MNRLAAALAVAVAIGALAAPAVAADHEVKMLNNGAGGQMVFEPSLLKIQPGDTVTFRAVHKGHNAQTIDVMTPDGGTKFHGKMNEEITVSFDKPGVYGYECKPHYGLGMVGLIVVGDTPANLDAARKAPWKGKAKERFTKLFQQLDG